VENLNSITHYIQHRT